MAIIKLNATTGLTGSLPAVSGASLTGITSGTLVKISSQTASGSSGIFFTSGIDSTYKAYHFEFNEIHLSSDGAEFGFQSDTGTNTNYNQPTTTTLFHAENSEGGSTGSLTYSSRSADNTTGMVELGADLGADNDQSMFGFLRVQNPSSTTFAKQFYARNPSSHQNDLTLTCYVDGYINTTSAITRFKFYTNAGTFDGIITLYGVVL